MNGANGFRRAIRREGGFTFIELLVVIIIIAILAALAIAIFLRQREKGWVAQVQAALANTRIAAESYRTEHGDFDGITTAILITEQGLRYADVLAVTVGPENGGSDYCAVATSFELPTSHEWQEASLSSEDGELSTLDDCP